MIINKGKSVHPGVAIGKIFVYRNERSTVKREKISNINSEVARLRKALDQAEDELHRLYEKALGEVGEINASIFDIHAMMLRDDDFNSYIENLIRTEKINAEYATAAAGDHFKKLFRDMNDDYMRERASDVADISERVIRILQNKNTDIGSITEPVIIFAEDLAPSETVQLDKTKVLSFVTQRGSPNSHTAILARNMGIPAIVGADIDLSGAHGQDAIVDGYEGYVYIDAYEGILAEKRKIQARDQEHKLLLENLRGKDNITLDGRKINVYANIENSRDLSQVLHNDAGGIGLFRSEFIYMESDGFPTEDEQFLVYKTVAQTMADKKVIIRTLDIGADKQAPYFNIPTEENPAMGMRAIRLCITNPEMFKTQLRAIYRAAVYGNISIMYPMITSLEELSRIKTFEREAISELYRRGEQYAEPERGIMIETPASVIIADLLAKEVDFFSIGTNDLIQYTMACDRQNPDLEFFSSQYKLPIMRMIEYVAKSAHNNNIWVGICGELGSDVTLTEDFVRMGIDELSVSPSKVLEIRQVIRNINTRSHS